MWSVSKGIYNIILNHADSKSNYILQISGSANSPALSVIINNDTIPGKITFLGQTVTMIFPGKKGDRQQVTLSGTKSNSEWKGTGRDAAGELIYWTANPIPQTGSLTTQQKKTGGAISQEKYKIYYPFNGYGWENKPEQKTLLIKNTTVWTNEKEGKLENTDVLIKNGKIAQVGKNLSAPGVQIIDGTNKHLTAGIIDEHSHIAVSGGVNEGSIR